MRKSVKSPSFKSSEVCGKGENRLGVDVSFLDRDFLQKSLHINPLWCKWLNSI